MTSAGGFASSSRLAQLRDLFVRAGFAFAELALDRLHLLAQISPPLRVGKLRLHILLQLLLDLRDLELRRDACLHRVQPLLDVVLLEQRLLLRDIEIQIWRQKIGQLLRILDPEHDRARLFRHVRRQLEQLRGRVAQISESGFKFLRCRSGQRVEQLDFRAQVWRRLRNLADREPPQPLHDDDNAIVRLPQ